MRGCVQVAILAIISTLLWRFARADVTAAADPRPNVVVIITDDQGYGDLGVHGNPKIKTPNLDAFAGEASGSRTSMFRPSVRRPVPAC